MSFNFNSINAIKTKYEFNIKEDIKNEESLLELILPDLNDNQVKNISELLTKDAISLLFSREDKIYETKWEMKDATLYTQYVIDLIENDKSIFFKNKEKIGQLKKTINELINSNKTITKNEEDQTQKNKNEFICDSLIKEITEKGSSTFAFGKLRFCSSQYLCRIIKNEDAFDIIIYAASKGINKSPFFDERKGGMTEGCYNFKGVPEENLKEIVTELVKLYGEDEKGRYKDKLSSKLAVCIEKKLGDYNCNSSKETKLFMKLQQTRNGVVKSMNGLFLQNLGIEDFKKYALEMKFQALLIAFSKESASKSPSIKHLKLTLSNFQKLLYKNRDKKWVNYKELFQVCGAIASKIDEMENIEGKPLFSPNTEISGSLKFSKKDQCISEEKYDPQSSKTTITTSFEGTAAHLKITEEIEESLRGSFKYDKEKPSFKSDSPSLLATHIEVISGENLCSNLNEVKATLEICNECLSGVYGSKKRTKQPYLSTILIVDNLFEALSPLLASEKSDLFKKITKEEAKSCLEALVTIMRSYNTAVGKVLCKSSLKTKVLFLECLRLAQKLALIANGNDDKILSKYGIYIQPYIDQVEKDPSFISLNEELLKRFVSITSYFVDYNKNKNEQLCNFWNGIDLRNPKNYPETKLYEEYGGNAINENSTSIETVDGKKISYKNLDRNFSAFIYSGDGSQNLLNNQINEILKGNKKTDKDARESLFKKLSNSKFKEEDLKDLEAETFKKLKNKRDFSLFNKLDPIIDLRSIAFFAASTFASDLVWKEGSSIKKIKTDFELGIKEYDLKSERKTYWDRSRSSKDNSISQELVKNFQYSHNLNEIHSENRTIHENSASQSFLDQLEIDLSVPEVQTLSILQLLESDISVLKEVKNRRAVELALFKVLRVNNKLCSPFFDALENNPSLHAHIDKITEKAVKIYFTPSQTEDGLDYPSMEAFLFILKLKALALQNKESEIKNGYKETAAQALIAALNELEKQAPSLEFKIDLKLTRLMLLQAKPYDEQSKEELAQAVSDFIFIKSILQEDLVYFHSENTISSGMGAGNFCEFFLSKFSSIPFWHLSLQNHMRGVKELLSKETKEELSKKGNAVLEKIIAESKDLQWGLNDKGWLESENEEGNWAINLQLGEVILPYGIPLQKEKFHPEENETIDGETFVAQLERLFPVRENVKEVGGELFFEDKRYGPVRCQGKIGSMPTIERYYNGKWYRYKPAPLNNEKNPYTFILSNYTAWTALSGENGKILEGIICDPNTGKTVYTIANGEFCKGDQVMVTPSQVNSFEDKSANKTYITRYECIPGKESRLIRQFDDNVCFWGKKEEVSKELKGIQLNSLEFLSFRTNSNQTLRFNYDSLKKQWRYNEDKEFFISSKKVPYLGERADYLTLENGNDMFKLILPKNLSRTAVKVEDDDEELNKKKEDPTVGYYEFDIDTVDSLPDPKKLSLEKQLFLIHFFTHEKRYEEAASYIDSLSSSESLSKEEKALILEILNSVNITGDDSPNVTAIQLALYAFAISSDPTSNYETFGANKEFSIGELYLSYISKIDMIDDASLLLPSVEMDIAERIKEISDKQSSWKKRVTSRDQDEDIKNLWLEKKLKIILNALKEKKYGSVAKYIDSLPNSKVGSKEEKELLVEILKFEHSSKEPLSANAIAIKLAVYSFALPATKTFYQVSKEIEKFSLSECYSLYLNQINLIDDSLLLPPPIELEMAKKILETGSVKDGRKKRVIKDRIAQIERIDSTSILKESWQEELVEMRIDLLRGQINKTFEEQKEEEPLSVHAEKIDFAQFNYEKEIDIEVLSKKLDYPEQLDVNRHLKSDYDPKYIDRELEGIAKGDKAKTIEESITTYNKKIQEIIDLNFSKEQQDYNLAYRGSPPSFDKIVRAAMRQDFNLAFKKLFLDLDEKTGLQLRFYCIMLMVLKADQRQFSKIKEAFNNLKKLENEGAEKSQIEEAKSKYETELKAWKRPFDPLKDPFCLLFEEISQLRIRPEQYDILKKIQGECSKKEFEGYLFELIMAGGKTKVIISALVELISYQDKVPIILSHHSQFAFTKGTIQNLQKTRFNKDVIAIDHSISDLNNIEILNSILKKLKKAKVCKLPIIMKNSTLQTLELKLLLDFEQCKNNNELEKQIEERNQI
jgi:hypothetical protein